MSPEEVRRLPVTVDIVTAGRCWGLGRNMSYRLARADRFPVPVLTLGARLIVTRASVLAALGIEDRAAEQDTVLRGADRPLGRGR